MGVWLLLVCWITKRWRAMNIWRRAIFAILKEIYWLVFERIEKKTKYSKVGFVFKEANSRVKCKCIKRWMFWMHGFAL
jgi:hypothetical protein